MILIWCICIIQIVDSDHNKCSWLILFTLEQMSIWKLPTSNSVESSGCSQIKHRYYLSVINNGGFIWTPVDRKEGRVFDASIFFTNTKKDKYNITKQYLEVVRNQSFLSPAIFYIRTKAAHFLKINFLKIGGKYSLENLSSLTVVYSIFK